MDWENNQPEFTKYKRSVIWESNKSALLIEKGLIYHGGSFFGGNFNSLNQCVGWLQFYHDFLKQNYFEIANDLNVQIIVEKPILEYAIVDQIDWFDLKMVVTIISSGKLLNLNQGLSKKNVNN